MSFTRPINEYKDYHEIFSLQLVNAGEEKIASENALYDDPKSKTEQKEAEEYFKISFKKVKGESLYKRRLLSNGS